MNSGAAKILGRAGLCAAVAAACAPAWLIVRYGVDVPYSDQWNIAHFFEKSARGALTLADLYAQQNEYRQLFPHALFVAGVEPPKATASPFLTPTSSPVSSGFSSP